MVGGASPPLDCGSRALVVNGIKQSAKVTTRPRSASYVYVCLDNAAVVIDGLKHFHSWCIVRGATSGHDFSPAVRKRPPQGLKPLRFRRLAAWLKPCPDDIPSLYSNCENALGVYPRIIAPKRFSATLLVRRTDRIAVGSARGLKKRDCGSGSLRLCQGEVQEQGSSSVSIHNRLCLYP